MNCIIDLLEQTLRDAANYENPYQSRYTVNAVSAITKGIIEIVGSDERLASAQSAVDRLINVGMEVSAQVPRICVECNEPHWEPGRMCGSCQSEHDWDESSE